MKRYLFIVVVGLVCIASAYFIGLNRGAERIWRDFTSPRYSAEHPSNEGAVFIDAYSRLLDETVIAGRSVGPTAGRGGFHKLFEIIYEHGERDDFRIMASHENPVVRAMGILCLKYRHPFEAYTAVLKSSRDREMVTWVEAGCETSSTSFGVLATLYIYGADDFLHTRALADSIDRRRAAANKPMQPTGEVRSGDLETRSP